MSDHPTRRDFVRSAGAAAAMPLLARVPIGAGAPSGGTDARPAAPRPDMDHDLLEISIARLHALYDARTYTVTQVTQWYLERIARYNPVYRAIAHVDGAGALATAAALDRAARRAGHRGPEALWGVPIVIKSNTSITGHVTNTGWYGYVFPGLELVAPMDATVAARLRAAGAVILGQTNMPDFAASDTNYSTVYGRTGNAYNVRCSPGGSSGGTVTAVTANLCVLGTGTDTGNSIRMPSGTSAVVGVLPTRGLTSIAGIHPLDWLRDNTGPIARSVEDAATALGVMAGADARDFRTAEAATQAQPGPYTKYLHDETLQGRRFGVPAFIVQPTASSAGPALQPETRALFLRALDALRAAGATVIVDDTLLPDTFLALIDRIDTGRYRAEGVSAFLRDYGPPAYRSPAEYAQATGGPLPPFMTGAGRGPATGATGPAAPPLASDPEADARLWGPQRAAVAEFDATLDRFHLDGYVYPAVQMPPNDELAMLAEGERSGGPHSATAWVNPIGTPAIVVPGGFYDNGLPFGVEFGTRRWRDGDLVGWAHAYEQATHARRPPTLVTSH